MSQIPTRWNLSDGTFTFVSHMHNFVNSLPRNGDSSRDVLPGDLTFSSTGIDDNNLPRNMAELLKAVPLSYITFAVYGNAKGSVSKHDCWQHNFLMMENYSDEKVDGIAAVARTDWEPDSGGPVKPFGGTTYNFDGEAWYKMYAGPKLLTKLTSGNRAQGAGSGCAFYTYGGWSEVKLSMLVLATVKVRSYCTTSNNISNSFCFTMMDDYFARKPGTVETSTTEYIRQYCARNIPGGDLSTASRTNQQLCACNMADYSKYNLGNNVAGVRTECFLDDCLRSNFKPGILNNCPAPECLNLVSIDRSPVTGGNLTIDQRNQCLNILKGFSNEDDLIGTDDNNIDDIINSPTDPTQATATFWSRNKFAIIIIVVILIMAIIGATLYFVMGDE